MTKLRFKYNFHFVKIGCRNDQIMQKNFHWGSKQPKSVEMTGCRNDCHSILHKHVKNSLQKVFKLFKKTLHTSIISESIQFF